MSAHPIHDFVEKYKGLLNKGYTEYKAFQIVEEELRELLEDQMDETRILRGAALANHGDSYLDRAQAVAELESEMKLQRFMRDIPKHERSSFNYDDPLATEDGVEEAQSLSETEYGEGSEEMRYDRLEDLFNMNRSEAF